MSLWLFDEKQIYGCGSLINCSPEGGHQQINFKNHTDQIHVSQAIEMFWKIMILISIKHCSITFEQLSVLQS